MVLGKFFHITLYFLLVTFIGIFFKYIIFISDFLLCFFCSDDGIQNVYEYIIVGGGSAGAIIANRLAKNQHNRILVLEAGRYDPELLHIPSAGLLLQQTIFDWNYKTVSQKNASLALDKNVSIWPMGKILGGTSMLNNMLYVRGHQEDFEEWFRYKENYAYSDVLEYFKRLEKHVSSENKDDADTENPIYIQDLIFTSRMPEAVLKAAKNLGYPIVEFNIDSKIGFSYPKANLHHGKRWTSADTIKLKTKPNLHIKTNRLVEKVLFRSNYEAYGVKYNYFGKKYTARAKKAVILSAGVIGTPKILMLSGIGHKDHLNQLGIKTVIDLPVGDNLQDHVTTGFGLILLNRTLDAGIEKMVSISSMLEYFIKGAGPWTTTGCELMAFFNTKNKSVESNSRPDLQFMVMPLGIEEDSGVYLRKLIGISDQTWSNYFSKIEQPTMTILPVLLHPKSKGTLRLASRDPLRKPIIDPKYLADPEDINVLLSGIDIIKSLIKSKELISFGAKLNTNIFPGCGNYLFDTKEYWECYIRHLTISSYHPVGTCKMGAFDDRSSVVDFNFQVKGTNKLFVADGSVLPSLSSGNINGPILMMAEMASDVLKKIEYLSLKRCAIIDIFIRKIVC